MNTIQIQEQFKLYKKLEKTQEGCDAFIKFLSCDEPGDSIFYAIKDHVITTLEEELKMAGLEDTEKFVYKCLTDGDVESYIRKIIEVNLNNKIRES